MAELKESIQNALAYIEEHLTQELEIREVARHAYLSTFYFQRIFAALCGVGVGEYIRNRRLTLAGEELARSEARVIDIAAKYGYESPDSFNRAFQRFHGISPSAARKTGASLRAYAPVKISLNLEGGNMMEYRIVEKPQFIWKPTVMKMTFPKLDCTMKSTSPMPERLPRKSGKPSFGIRLRSDKIHRPRTAFCNPGSVAYRYSICFRSLHRTVAVSEITF